MDVGKNKQKSHNAIDDNKQLRQDFPIGDEYELHKHVGKGSYGVVIRARHLVFNLNVAIKKVTNVFDNLGDAKRLLREVQLLH